MSQYSRGRRAAAGAVLGLLVLGGAMPAAEAQTAPAQSGPADRSTTVPDSGVIKPPPVQDPGLRKPPPADGGTIKVIPPPGTPGNQPDVVPK